MKSFAAVVAVLLAALVASPASAGSLNDFRRSVDHRRNNDDPPPPPPPRVVHQPSPYYYAHEPAWWTVIFVGHTPPPAFSFGRGVYDRGVTAAHGDLSFMSEATAGGGRRSTRLQLRLEGMVSPNTSEPEVRYSDFDTPVGVGVFAKIESTATPGFVIWHQRVMDFAASDRLGITHLAMDPRIYTGARGQVFWTIGVPIYGSENGVLNAGGLLGFGFDIAPARPFVAHARLNASMMYDTIVGDFYVDGGIEVLPGLQAVVGYRALVSASPLHLFTVGVQLDRGLGRGARSVSAASAP